MENARHHRSVGKSHRATGHPCRAGTLLGDPTTPRLAASNVGLWTTACGNAFVVNRVRKDTSLVGITDRMRDQKLFRSRWVQILCKSKNQIIESLRLVNEKRVPRSFKNFDLSSRTILL